MTTAFDLAARLATVGLPDADGAFPREPLEAGEWSQFLSVARSQRLTGFLVAAYERDQLVCTERQFAEALEAHLSALASALILERKMLEAVSLLEGQGLVVRVIKGPALAHTIYPDPSLRLYGDIDILIRSDQFDEAMAILGRHGYERPVGQPRPGFDRRFGKGATLVDGDGYQLDVHRTFVFGGFGLAIDLDDLFDGSTSFRVGGRTVLTLAPDQGFLHACYHAALGNPEPRLVAIRDIVQLLDSAPVDRDHVQELARRWGGTAVVARALALVSDVLGLPVDDALARWALAHRPTPRERRTLAGHVGANHRFAVKVGAALPYIEGIPAKAAFVRALVFPSRSFIGSREAGYARWLRRGARSLLGGRR